VHLPALPAQAEGTVYFYDHRNASGILPKMGGILELGPLTDVRTILAADQSLWMQTGTGLQVWAGK